MNNVTIRKKAMISQQMNGLTHEEIQAKREKVAIKLERMGYEVVNQYLEQCEAINPIAALLVRLTPWQSVGRCISVTAG